MNTQTVNSDPPTGYPICTSESCSQRTHCLHACIAPEVLRTAQTYNQINSQHPDYQEGTACHHYRSATPERYARGFTQAMSELSRKNYSAMTHYLIATRSRARFYRIKRGDIPLSPAEQTELEQTFRAYGYESPLSFDSYEERYTWY